MIPGTGVAARALSQRMMTAFGAFAASGSPSAPGGAPWSQYRLPERHTMLFDVADRAVADPRRWERELFAQAPYIQPGSRAFPVTLQKVARVGRATRLTHSGRWST